MIPAIEFPFHHCLLFGAQLITTYTPLGRPNFDTLVFHFASDAFPERNSGTLTHALHTTGNGSRLHLRKIPMSSRNGRQSISSDTQIPITVLI